MEYFRASESFRFPQRPLAEGIAEVQALLGRNADRVIPQRRKVISVAKDYFQSSIFRLAGFHLMHETYGKSDATIFTLLFDDDATTYVITGKPRFTSTTSRFGGVGSLGDGSGTIDIRDTRVVSYEWSGYKLDDSMTLTEILSSGKEHIYRGEWAAPPNLLDVWREQLGTFVGREIFEDPE